MWKKPGSNSNSHRSSRCAMIFQDDALFPWMRVLHNVAFARTVGAAKTAAFTDNALAAAQTFLIDLGLGEYSAAWPRELSGGMRKRVELARAIFAKPRLLLLDEAFGSLDSVTKSQVYAWFTCQIDRLRLTSVMVTSRYQRGCGALRSNNCISRSSRNCEC